MDINEKYLWIVRCDACVTSSVPGGTKTFTLRKLKKTTAAGHNCACNVLLGAEKCDKVPYESLEWFKVRPSDHLTSNPALCRSVSLETCFHFSKSGFCSFAHSAPELEFWRAERQHVVSRETIMQFLAEKSKRETEVERDAQLARQLAGGGDCQSTGSSDCWLSTDARKAVKKTERVAAPIASLSDGNIYELMSEEDKPKSSKSKPGKKDKKDFTTDKEDFTADKKDFTTDKKNFTSDKKDFTTDKKDFTSDKRDFTQDKRDFTQGKIDFTQEKREFTPEERELTPDKRELKSKADVVAAELPLLAEDKRKQHRQRIWTLRDYPPITDTHALRDKFPGEFRVICHTCYDEGRLRVEAQGFDTCPEGHNFTYHGALAYLNRARTNVEQLIREPPDLMSQSDSPLVLCSVVGRDGRCSKPICTFPHSALEYCVWYLCLHCGYQYRGIGRGEERPPPHPGTGPEAAVTAAEVPEEYPNPFLVSPGVPRVRPVCPDCYTAYKHTKDVPALSRCTHATTAADTVFVYKSMLDRKYHQVPMTSLEWLDATFGDDVTIPLCKDGLYCRNTRCRLPRTHTIQTIWQIIRTKRYENLREYYANEVDILPSSSQSSEADTSSTAENLSLLPEFQHLSVDQTSGNRRRRPPDASRDPAPEERRDTSEIRPPGHDTPVQSSTAEPGYNTDILSFLNENFYNDTLVETNPSPSLPGWYGLQFVDCPGEESFSGPPGLAMHSPDRLSNELEAREVVRRLMNLRSNWPAQWGVFDQSQVAVFTPYLQQERRIAALLQKAGMPDVHVEAQLCADISHARRFRVAVLSPVRTLEGCLAVISRTADSDIPGLEFGYLSDKALLGCAVAAGKDRVIAVGDAAILTRLGDSRDVWARLIQRSVDNNTVLPPSLTIQGIAANCEVRLSATTGDDGA